MRINSIDNKMSFGQKNGLRNVKNIKNTPIKGLSKSSINGLTEKSKNKILLSSALFNTSVIALLGLRMDILERESSSLDELKSIVQYYEINDFLF